MGFLVDSDSIKQYGAQTILLALTKSACQSPCFADLWDNKDAYQLNGENLYGKRTERWQKKHYAFIADHLVAAKISANSDEVVDYPLTYDSNYKRWGGKLNHK